MTFLRKIISDAESCVQKKLFGFEKTLLLDKSINTCSCHCIHV